jgi:hypothetical protein
MVAGVLVLVGRLVHHRSSGGVRLQPNSPAATRKRLRRHTNTRSGFSLEAAGRGYATLSAEHRGLVVVMTVVVVLLLGRLLENAVAVVQDVPRPPKRAVLVIPLSQLTEAATSPERELQTCREALTGSGDCGLFTESDQTNELAPRRILRRSIAR